MITSEKPQAELLDISNEEYHARDEWSSSQVKLLPEQPMLFHGRHIARTMPFKPTAAMALGTAVHRILLDGTPIMVIPADVLSKSGSKAGNAWKDFRAEHEGSSVLVKVDDPIKHMLANLRSHEIVQQLLAASVFREQSIVWTDPETGLPCRARPDDVAAVQSRYIEWDLKTTSDLAPRKLSQKVDELGYHRSLDWYSDGLAHVRPDLQIHKYLIVWVRSAPPYDVSVRPIHPMAMANAAGDNREARLDLVRRLDSGDWLPKDYHKIGPSIDLPEYCYSKKEV